MAGGFYRRDELRKSFFWGFAGCLLGFGSIVAAGLMLLVQNKIDFEKLANVTFVDPRSIDPTKAQPVSQIIEDVAQSNTQASANTVLYGYLENVREICKSDPSDTKERILVVTSLNGSTSLGRAKIGPKTCEILNQAQHDGQHVFAASDEALPSQRRHYIAIKK